MKKKRFLRFRDWRILTKLLVVMLFLSWIPVLVSLATNIQSRSELSRLEIDNLILRLVSGNVREIQQQALDFITKHHAILQTIASDEEIIQLIDQVSSVSGQQPSPGQEPPSGPPSPFLKSPPPGWLTAPL